MYALVPVKTLDAAKQRLAKLLPAAARKRLTIALLGDVLDTLTAHPGIERVLVVSADRQVAGIAEESGAAFLDEAKLAGSGLNGSVNAAVRHLARKSVRRVLVAHGDLPKLNEKELSRFIAIHTAAPAPAVTLTPDGRRDGTNLLAWHAASDFRADYGPGSFARHCHQCQRLGIVPTVCVLPDAGFDIDLPEDFIRMKMLRDGLGRRTSALLAERAFFLETNRQLPEALRR